MTTLQKWQNGWNVANMMSLQDWNCNKVVLIRQKLNGMPSQMKKASYVCHLDSLHQIQLPVQEKQVKITIKTKISSSQVTKEIRQLKNQRTKSGMGLLIQLQTAHQQQAGPSLPPLIQAMVESGLQTERFLRILSGTTVRFQVSCQHGAGGRLQQGKNFVQNMILQMPTMAEIPLNSQVMQLVRRTRM